MSESLPAGFPNMTLLLEDTYKAIVELGGSGTNEEIYATVKKNLKLPYDPEIYRHLGSSTTSELYYRIAWAKTKLKKQGKIDNPKKGIWTIKSPYDVTPLDGSQKPSEIDEENEEIEGFEPWREELLETLQNINPYSFEVLAQRLLRECGFESVKVTKKSRDGGIDGEGKLKVNGIFCFNVAFQCKRYKGTVPASDIRDFRGSLPKAVEKGIFITTGTFSKDAIDEASDSSKAQIDLIDGSELVDKLCSLGLGVKTTFAVDKEFFKELDSLN